MVFQKRILIFFFKIDSLHFETMARPSTATKDNSQYSRGKQLVTHFNVF